MMNELQNIKYTYKKPGTLSAHKKAPLLLLIHGYGSNEEDLLGLTEKIPKHFAIISLRAPITLPFGGYAWYNLNVNATAADDTHSGFKINQQEANQAKEKLKTLIVELVKKYDLNPNDVWLMGFSQGAILSYAIALETPNLVRRALCLSGFLDKSLTKIEIPSNADYSHLNLFISHGFYDVVIPMEWVEEGQKTLEGLSIKHTLKKYAAQHTVNQENLQDLIQWINEQDSVSSQ